jgi:hypothetical protein
MNKVYIFIGGYKSPGGVRCADDANENGYKMNGPMKNLSDGAVGKYLGLEGTIDSATTVNNGWSLLHGFLLQNVKTDGKLIIYGYSAGGNNALEFCRRIEAANVTRSASSQPLIKVDLLITVDPAGRTDKGVPVNGLVAGCVVKNVNYYQTQTFWTHARSTRTSVGGPGQGGTTPNISNTDLTDSLSLGTTSKHEQIEDYTLQTALGLMQSA